MFIEVRGSPNWFDEIFFFNEWQYANVNLLHLELLNFFLRSILNVLSSCYNLSDSWYINFNHCLNQLVVLVFFFFLKEASSILDIQNIKHISEDKELIGDVVEKIADDWHVQKQTFYKQTGLGETDEYEQELEQLLLQQYSDDDWLNQDWKQTSKF